MCQTKAENLARNGRLGIVETLSAHVNVSDPKNERDYGRPNKFDREWMATQSGAVFDCHWKDRDESKNANGETD
jgi:hypothetical protein